MNKELIRVIREPANLFMVLIFPLILTMAFGFAFGAFGSNIEVQYKVGMIDNDVTDWSRWFRGNVTNMQALSIFNYEDEDAAYNDLKTGKLSAFIIIPEGFGACIENFRKDPQSISGNEVVLELALDKGSMIVEGIIPPFIQRSLTSTIFGEKALSPPSPVSIGTPIFVDPIKLTQFDFMMPGVFSFAAIFLTMIIAQVLTEERNMGILSRISTTPTTSEEIYVSLICSNLIIGTIQVLMILGASYLLGFRPQTELFGYSLVIISVLLVVIANVGFGLIIAAIAKTSSSATGLAFIFILPQMFLGSFIPVSSESVSKLVPTFYATEIIKNLFLRGAETTSTSVQLSILILVFYALVVGGIGVFIFNKFGKK